MILGGKLNWLRVSLERFIVLNYSAVSLRLILNFKFDSESTFSNSLFGNMITFMGVWSSKLCVQCAWSTTLMLFSFLCTLKYPLDCIRELQLGTGKWHIYSFYWLRIGKFTALKRPVLLSEFIICGLKSKKICDEYRTPPYYKILLIFC